VEQIWQHQPGIEPHAKRIILLGNVNLEQGILLVERTAFTESRYSFANLCSELTNLANIGTNDIYHWFLASPSAPSLNEIKLTLIHPCTPKHISKYTPQVFHSVTETAAIYKDHVQPYMAAQREAGRLNWVFNILEGKAEQDDVLYQEHGEFGFLVSPDLNWDRKTMEGLHVLALVERRDVWSLRDLTKSHIPWLREMRTKILRVVSQKYELEEDRLKLYVHYQPTYYHFHIHVVHVALDAGATQAVGKAFGLENHISQLDCMAEDKGLAHLDITYTIGENHDLWKNVFGPLKTGINKDS
jgi:m7GpppX diphosphatase